MRCLKVQTLTSKSFRIDRTAWLNWSRICLASVFFLSALFDSVTLMLRPEFHIFEVNPIYLLTGRMWVVLGVKWVVVEIVLLYLMFMTQKINSGIRYALVLMTLYFTIFQVYGGLMNLRVQNELPSPDPQLVLEPAVATQHYYNTFVLPVYGPVLLAVLAFKLHEWGKYEECGVS